MPVFQDAYGLSVTSSSQSAVDHYVRGIGLMLARNAGAQGALEAASEADDTLALAPTALAHVHQTAGRAAEARAAAATAQKLSAGTSWRERRQVEVVCLAVDGQTAKAIDLAREHLKELPRDAIVVRQLQNLVTASGRADRKELTFGVMRDVAMAYGDDSWFLGAYSFQHTEAYRFAEARRLADRSYALNPQSCDCAHSMAHVLYETGEHDSGSDFLDGWLDGSVWQSGYAGHLNWHLALFELGRGAIDEALTVYQDRLAPGKHATGGRLALSDAASFLWRCELFGIEPPAGAAADVAGFATKSFPRSGQAFPDVHRAMAFALAQTPDALEGMLKEVRELVEAGKMPAGPVVPAIVEAIGQFVHGEYKQSADTLDKYREEFVRVGGSRAQFEVLVDTLIVARIRAGDGERVEPLLKERLERRPSRRDEGWARFLRS